MDSSMPLDLERSLSMSLVRAAISLSSTTILFSSSALGLLWDLSFEGEEKRKGQSSPPVLVEAHWLLQTLGREDSLQLLNSSLRLRDPLLPVLHVELDFSDGDLDLRNPLLDLSGFGLERLLVALERRELLLSLDALLLVSRYDLRLNPVGRKLGAHPSLLDSGSSSAHGSRDVDEISSERDDSPPLLAVGNPVGLLKGLGDKRVSGGLEESGGEAAVLGLDEVKETRDVLGRLELAKILIGELVEDKDVGSTSSSTKVLDNGLSLLDVVRDERVEASPTGGGDSDIVLVVNDSEVSETSLERSTVEKVSEKKSTQHQIREASRGSRSDDPSRRAS